MMKTTYNGKIVTTEERQELLQDKTKKVMIIRKKVRKKNIIMVRRIIAVSLVMIAMFTMFSFASESIPTKKETIQANELEIKEYEQVKVTIAKGDRAWNIQKKLTPNKDIRHMLYLDAYINDNQMGDLKAGQVAIFLKEK